MKHRWVRDSKGEIRYFQYGDIHGGPRCAECGEEPCEHCNPHCYDEDCNGRRGFEISVLKYTNKYHEEKLFGIRWNYKALYIGFWFIAVKFDFSGLFPFSEEA